MFATSVTRTQKIVLNFFNLSHKPVLIFLTGPMIILGAFTCNLDISSVFTVEVHGFILAMEYAPHDGWTHIWLESDYTSAILVFNKQVVGACFALKSLT